MTEIESEVLESHRPALQKLALDLRDLREELLGGFESRRDVLEWSQRLTIRTLGEIDQRWFLEIARQFRGDPEGALLSALLVPSCRDRDLEPDAVDELRQRIAATLLGPSEHRALRRLRDSAGEYLDDSETSSGSSRHDPSIQRYIAMRPALDELERYQQETLATCLDGISDRREILEWGESLELATHGELSETFLERCYREPSTSSMLTSTAPADERARELFSAHHLIPAYNSGVRDLADRAGEQPDGKTERAEPEFA